MNPYLCGFYFFLPLGELNITPKNEEHEKDLLLISVILFIFQYRLNIH